MRVSPVASPAAVQQTSQTQGINPEAKARAIAMLTGSPQSQEVPQVDANNISPEEISAVKAQSQQDNSEVSETQDVEIIEEIKEEEPKVDPKVARQFAQLARQEKQLRLKVQQQDQAMKAREQAIQAKEQELSSKYSLDQDKYINRDDLKRNTLQALADAGVSYEELTQQILNQGSVDPRTEALITKQEARIAQLEAKIDKSAQAVIDQQQDSYKAAVRQIELDAKQLITMDPNFETIKATNNIREVVNLITQTYEQDGVLLSVEDAAQQVEDYLVEEALKVTRIGKIKSRLEQSAQKVQTEKQTPAQPRQTQPGMKTLTNAVGTTRQLSTRERAIAAMEGKLK